MNICVIQKNGDFYISKPIPGMWLVYEIRIGKYVYYGSTNNYKKRMQNHRQMISRLLRKEKLQSLMAMNFKVALDITQTVTYEIVAICEDRKSCYNKEIQMIAAVQSHWLNTKSAKKFKTPLLDCPPVSA